MVKKSYLTGIFLLFVFISTSSFGQGMMKSNKSRNVLGIFPGTIVHKDAYSANIEIHYLHQKIYCDNELTNEVIANYSFLNDYQNVGLAYRFNITIPYMEGIMIYPFMTIKGSYFTTEIGEAWLASPGLGISFVFNRRENPYLVFDLGYNYNYEIDEKGYYPFNNHSIQPDLGIGIVW